MKRPGMRLPLAVPCLMAALALSLVSACNNATTTSIKATDGTDGTITEKKATQDILTNLPILLPDIDRVTRSFFNNGVFVETYYRHWRSFAEVSYSPGGGFGIHSSAPAHDEKAFLKWYKRAVGDRTLTLSEVSPQEVNLIGESNGGRYVTDGDCTFLHMTKNVGGRVTGIPNMVLKLGTCTPIVSPPEEIIRKIGLATAEDKAKYKNWLANR